MPAIHSGSRHRNGAQKKCHTFDYINGHDFGVGIDAVNGLIKGDAVIRTAPEEVSGAEGQKVLFDMMQVETTEELTEALGASAEVNVGMGLFNASAQFNFAQQASVNRYSLYLLVSVSVTNAFRQLRDVRLTRDAVNLWAEEWEIAAMHREHRAGEGACVRATWVKVDPDQIDGGIDFYKTTILPALEELEGFCSASLLVDRASGRGVAAATFDNAEALETNWTGSGPRAVRKQTQRYSTSATSSWQSHTCVCPKWPDRRRGAAQAARTS